MSRVPETDKNKTDIFIYCAKRKATKYSKYFISICHITCRGYLIWLRAYLQTVTVVLDLHQKSEDKIYKGQNEGDTVVLT